ncbi:unnamed protein product [Rhizoctonia solani]|uniref:Jacalin-type lectin domain-containing protein n=1 Tax=Rhizoctonia solani TaxID=456999 RepID=A0A8H3CWU3_9AGAM|nr:unnamed protein product [Rhizoctonia solani]
MSESDKSLLKHLRILSHGFSLDPDNGPARSSRRVIQEFRPKQDWADWSKGDPKAPSDSHNVKPIDGERMIEDEYSETRLDAYYANLGWPLLVSPFPRPWSVSGAMLQAPSGRWATRRMLIKMWSINLGVNDLTPADAYVDAIERALECPNDTSRIRALEEVFALWGDVIPVAAIVGSTIVATGELSSDTNFDSFPSAIAPQNQTNFGSLNDFIDTQLQIQDRFESALKYHITGSRPDILFREGLESWLKSIENTQEWEIIKVTRVIQITDILDPTIQGKIKELYSNCSIPLRSPPVGVSPQFGFDITGNGLCPIQRVDIGFSDVCIKSISIIYAGGSVAGPFGRPEGATRFDRFDLSGGEYIAGIFVWPTDHFIASLQLVKNTGYVSPIYGAMRGITQPPCLLSENGKALGGLAGGYDAIGITQLQAVWRNDIQVNDYRYTRTVFVGGQDGEFWNDLRFIGDRFSARISKITTRSSGAGYLGSIQTTYTSLVGGYPSCQESPVHGTEDGPITTWTLEDGEYITEIRGSHDGTSICQLWFTTNRCNRKPRFIKTLILYSDALTLKNRQLLAGRVDILALLIPRRYLRKEIKWPYTIWLGKGM